MRSSCFPELRTAQSQGWSPTPKLQNCAILPSSQAWTAHCTISVLKPSPWASELCNCAITWPPCPSSTAQWATFVIMRSSWLLKLPNCTIFKPNPTWTAHCAVIRLKPNPWLPELRNCDVLEPLPQPAAPLWLSQWIIMQHLRLGVYRLMSSCHEWIADAGTLSYYDRMMKKEMEKENMLEDTLVAEDASWSIRRNQRDINLWPQLKT